MRSVCRDITSGSRLQVDVTDKERTALQSKETALRSKLAMEDKGLSDLSQVKAQTDAVLADADAKIKELGTKEQVNNRYQGLKGKNGIKVVTDDIATLSDRDFATKYGGDKAYMKYLVDNIKDKQVQAEVDIMAEARARVVRDIYNPVFSNEPAMDLWDYRNSLKAQSDGLGRLNTDLGAQNARTKAAYESTRAEMLAKGIKPKVLAAYWPLPPACSFPLHL